MNQSKTIIITFASIAALFLAACGSESGSSVDTGEVEEVKTVYSLGACKAENEGVTKLVTSENRYYKCVDGDWEKTDAPVQSSSSNNAIPGLDTKSSASNSGPSSGNNAAFVDPSTVVMGTMTDERDGQTYKTVKIGDQVWMAENLKYRYLGPTAELDSSSFCYGGDPAKCDTSGRLYLWSAAMDSAGIIEGNTANGCGDGLKCFSSGIVRGVCPIGWHLPSRAEWEKLVVEVDDSVTEYTSNNTTGIRLKSTSDWNEDDELVDAYSFTAIPAGCRVLNGAFAGWHTQTSFWSSTGDDSNIADNIFFAYAMSLHSPWEDGGLNRAIVGIQDKSRGCSVRCLQD